MDMETSESRFTGASLKPEGDGTEYSLLQLTIRNITMTVDNEAVVKHSVDYKNTIFGNATFFVQGEWLNDFKIGRKVFIENNKMIFRLVLTCQI